MFLPAQLICRPKLGLEISSYLCRGRGGPHLFNAQIGHYYIRSGAGSFGLTAARCNMRKPCLVHLDTTYEVWRKTNRTDEINRKQFVLPQISLQVIF
jgi:hypothetical protein